jgi:hypothetical protein
MWLRGWMCLRRWRWVRLPPSCMHAQQSQLLNLNVLACSLWTEGTGGYIYIYVVPCTGSTCTARTMKNAAAAKIAKKRSRSTSEEQGRRGASIFILLLCAGRPALSISMLSVFRGAVQCSQPWCLALQFVGRGGAGGGCFHQVKSG